MARRTPPKVRTHRLFRGVYRTYPLFMWRKCLQCEQEFRREWGWVFDTGPRHHLGGVELYSERPIERSLCSKCVSTHEQAVAYAMDYMKCH